MKKSLLGLLLYVGFVASGFTDQAWYEQCGFSAIKLPEPVPMSMSHCTTSPAPGGGWATDCTQQ